MDKAKSKSVALGLGLWDTVEDHARKYYGGNRSAYIKRLIEADLSGYSSEPIIPSAKSRGPLMQLFENFLDASYASQLQELEDAGQGCKLSQSEWLVNVLSLVADAELQRDRGFETHISNCLHLLGSIVGLDSNAKIKEHFERALIFHVFNTLGILSEQHRSLKLSENMKISVERWRRIMRVDGYVNTEEETALVAEASAPFKKTRKAAKKAPKTRARRKK